MNLKGLGILIALMLMTAAAKAVDTFSEPIRAYTAPEAVSVATGAYTNVTSAAVRALKDQSEVLVDNPSTNTGIMHGHVGNCTSTAISTSSVKGPFEFPPSAAGPVFVPIASDECLWLVSRHTAAESITVQGVSRKRQ